MGSIPKAALVIGALVLLSLIRIASLMAMLKATSEIEMAGSRKGKPKKQFCTVTGACLETVWAFGVSAAAGLLLLS